MQLSARPFGGVGLVAVELIGPIGELGVRRHAVLGGIAERGNPPGLGAVYGRFVLLANQQSRGVFPSLDALVVYPVQVTGITSLYPPNSPFLPAPVQAVSE